jgi:hypothetical protein
MMASLVWSLATKVADIVCGVWNCICRKSTQPQTTIIPQYQRKYWYNNSYGYELINDTPSASSAKQQRQYKDSITYTSRPTDKNNYYDQHGQKKSATLSTTIHDNNRGGVIQYSAGRCRHPIITTDLHYYDIVIPRPIQTDPFISSENKPPNFKNAPPPAPVALDKKNIAPLKAHVQAKTKRNKTSRQQRLYRKRQKDGDIGIKPIVFNDNDVKYTAMRTKAHEALLLKITSRKKSDQAFNNGNKKQGGYFDGILFIHVDD